MKKFISIILISIILPALCFAAVEITFRQMTECMYVNLASTKFPSHPKNVSWGTYVTPSNPARDKYYSDQILSIIGVKADTSASSSARLPSNEDIVVKAELMSGYWCYVLDGTDIRYMRPFGIQMVGRGKVTDLYSDSGSHQNIGTDYNFYLGGTTGSSTTVTLPGSVAKNYSGVWWDMILVFDNNVNTTNDTVYGADDTTLYNLIATDSYYTASVKLTLTVGTVSESFDVFLNGYYKASDAATPASSSGLYSSMNVTRLATANAVDIKTLFNANEATKVDVATYNYTTNTLEKARAGTVYFFASSVSSGLNRSAEEFVLRHVGADGTISYRDTNHNALKYYVYMNSERGHSSSEANTVVGSTVKFNGTSYYSGGNFNNEYLVLEKEEVRNQDGTKYTRWYDTGTIQVGIPSSQSINGKAVTIDSLLAGQYTSNIYLHIVTNF